MAKLSFYSCYKIQQLKQMQQQNEQKQPLFKKKQPFVLQVSHAERPNRVMSLNRLNYAEDLKKDGTFVAKKDIIEHDLFDHHIVQSNMNIQRQLKKLHATFIYEKVPDFYAYFFMNQLINASQQKLQDNIFKETEQIKTKRSYFHVITNAIKAREGCLKQLQRCLNNLFQNQEDNITKHVFREQVMHYRKLTGFVIAHIRSWKEYLKSISPEITYITYYVKGQDYLIKIMEDTQFLFNSFLAKDLKFHFKNDPYVMRPSIDSSKEAKFYSLFSFEEQQKVQYISDMNYLAEQRAKSLQSKMNSKNDKIKEIQKIYNYKENPLASRIFIKKLHLHERRPSGEDDSKQKNSEISRLKESQKRINNFVDDEKKMKLQLLNKKGDKIKRIKQLYKNKAYSQQKLVHTQNIFKDDDISPYERKLRYTQFNPKKQPFQKLNTDNDFQNLVRKKQLKVLQNYAPGSTQKLSRTFKIKDSISESRSKFLNKDQGAEELEKILSQLEKLSPQKLDSYRIGNSSFRESNLSASVAKFQQSRSIKTSRYVEPMKTALAHNEQVFVSIRNQVIQEIEKGRAQKDLLQKQKMEENERIQEILQKKINEESIRVIRNSRVKDVEGREQLAKEMNSADIFGYHDEKMENSQKLTAIQEELKKEMQLKWLREVQAQLKHRVAVQEMEEERRKDQDKMNKQLKKIEEKAERQKRYQEIQREERALAKKKIIQLDEERKREIEEQMKKIIAEQREKMQKVAMIQKMQIEQQLRQAMKKKILDNLKQQKERFYDENKKLSEKQQAESNYREQIRQKIQEQYQIGMMMKRNREKQQKMNKLKLIRQKLQDVDKKAAKSKVSKKQEDQQSQVKGKQLLDKSDLIEMRSKVTEIPFRSPQNDKKKLRQQFQLQLFSFRVPQSYSRSEIQKEGRENLQNESAADQIKFLKKDYKTRIDEEVNKIEEQQEQKEEKQTEKIDDGEQIQEIKLAENQKKSRKMSASESEKFTRFSQKQNTETKKQNQDELMRMKLGMTIEQYTIYKKKKQATFPKKDRQEWEYNKKQKQQELKPPQKIEQFQRMEIEIQGGEQDNFMDNQAFPSDNNQPIHFSPSSKSQISKSQAVIEQLRSQKSEKKEKSPQKRDRHENFEIMTANSRVDSVYKKHFITSESQEEQQRAQKRRKKPVSKKIKRKQKQIKQEKQQKQLNFSPVIEDEAPKKTMVKIREVPLDKIQQFFNDHFEHMPKTLKKISIYKKEELIKVLLEYNCFTIMEFIKDSLSIGIAIFVYNQNKTQYRSLNIVHLGIYEENEKDYLDLFVNTTKMAMKKDPCEEVALSVIYDTQISQQMDFIKKLEKVFDPYGAIFQKKIFNTQFERKMIIRRPIGEEFKDNIQYSNLGAHQLEIDFFISQNILSDFDDYEPIGYRVGCYGLVGHYISQKAEQEKLAQLIKNSTMSNDPADKSLGYLAKLSLAMKVNQSFMRLNQITQEQYSDIMNLNLDLISKSKKVVAYPPQKVEEKNKNIWMNFKQNIILPYNFYNQTIKITLNDSNEDQEQYLCKYLRYTPLKFASGKNRMYTIKSTAYSSNVHILPCKNNTKYKIFLLDSEQYDQLKKPTPLDVYMRVLFANLEKHEISDFQNVWLPEVSTSGKYEMTQFDTIIGEHSVLRTKWDFTYIDYLGNSLKISPSHRDLVVTTPFIFGVINMQIQKVVEGSPIYIQRVSKEDLRYTRKVDKIIKQSD